MKTLLPLLLLSPLLSIGQQDSTYQLTLDTIAKYRAEMTIENKTNDVSARTAGRYFKNYLTNKVIPYWYGTQWDFNGHTNTPNKGKIACGYFVSTTLKHMGVNINRYHLAWQGGYNMAKSIACGDTIYWFNYSEIFNQIKKLNHGLYFVGLDNHVGYLLIDKDGGHFIHSDYVHLSVRKESTKESTAFNASSRFCITPISRNKKLMQKWLDNEVVTVIKNSP